MSLDPRAFAALLCDYCLQVRAGQQVLVQSTTLAAPLLLALQRAVMEREAWPLLRASLPEQDVEFWNAARDVHLDTVASADRAEAEQIDALLRIDAPFNTRALAGSRPRADDPGRVGACRVARAAAVAAVVRDGVADCGGRPAGGDVLRAISRRSWSERCSSTATIRSPPGVSSRAAGGDDRAAVDGLARSGSRLPGTDLTLSVAGRSWINSDGKRNMPSGEVFTGPVETSAEGHIRFDIPSSPRGVEVAGIALEFREGRVVSARAEQGDEVLQAMLDTDDGARVLGELGIGTNPGVDRPIGSIMVDEKIGGTVHLAVGRSYPETGGTNVSAIHWDMICDLRRGGL